jgi:SNF2 family DNA or RNA helicase
MVVLGLQSAQEAGAPLKLAHFENLRLSKPDSIGVAVTEAEDGSGDVVLSPTLAGHLPENISARLSQIQKGLSESLRINNEIVLLTPKAMEAVEEIISVGRISKGQVATFLNSPTTFLTGAMIDLDTGFSLRVQGAERYQLRYFGETEAQTQDWFSGAIHTPVPLQTAVGTAQSEAEIEDIRERVGDAERNGASLVPHGDIVIELPTQGGREICNQGLEAFRQRRKDKEAHDDYEEPAEAPEAVVVAIAGNDESTDISGNFDVNDFAPERQEFGTKNLARTPFSHQAEGIRWILAHLERHKAYQTGGALLADDMGLGKTYVSLVALAEAIERSKNDEAAAKPHLIVAPVSLLENWQTEVDLAFKTNPFRDIVVLQAGADLRRFRVEGARRELLQVLDENGRVEDPDQIRHSLKVGRSFGNERLDLPNRLVLTTYQTLRDYQFSLARVDWGLAVFDEAQNLKNPNAIVTRAAKALKSDFKLLATGTPVENSLKDFWCIMDTCTPGLLGNWQAFRNAYIQPILNANSNPNVKQKVGRHLRDAAGTFMLRRTKEGNLSGLPKKTIWTGAEPTPREAAHPALSAVMPPAQQAAYDKVVNEVRQLAGQDKRGAALSALQRLRAISIHPALVQTNEALLTFKVAESGKLQATFGLLREIRERGEKCIIFIISKRAQQLVAAALATEFGLEVNIINGDTKTNSRYADETRQGIINRFQEASGFDVIIMSPIAAGVGFTVTAANHVIHLERHWNPAKEAQASDRVYRIGQEREVNIYLPMAAHPTVMSFDLRLNNLLRNKVDLSDAVVAIEAVAEDEMLGLFDDN